MKQKSQFEHLLDPELLEEIEEWEQQEHTEPEEYYFSNPDPYFKPAPLPPNHPKHNCWLSGCRSSLYRKRLVARSTPSQAAMTGQKRWTEKWSALWLKSLQKSWRIPNDKFTDSW